MITATRLGTITRTQFQAALDRFDLGPLQSVSLAEGGMGGQNVFIEPFRAWAERRLSLLPQVLQTT